MVYEPEMEEEIGGARQECAKFIQSLLKVNMCMLLRSKAEATNSIFFLRRPNGKLRFIIAAFKANMCLIKPEYIDLGGPRCVAALQSTKPPMYSSKSDLSDAGFHWRVPVWVWEYLGLPVLSGDELRLDFVKENGNGV